MRFAEMGKQASNRRVRYRFRKTVQVTAVHDGEGDAAISDNDRR